MLQGAVSPAAEGTLRVYTSHRHSVDIPGPISGRIFEDVFDKRSPSPSTMSIESVGTSKEGKGVQRYRMSAPWGETIRFYLEEDLYLTAVLFPYRIRD